MILLQRLERPVQGVRHGRDVLQLLRRQLVEILIHRITWLDTVLDAIQTSHHRSGERQVRVTRWVRRAELDALGLRVGPGDRDADRGGAVLLGVHQVHRRLEARHQAVVGVHRRVRERQHGTGVLEDAADVVARHVGEPTVTVLVVEQRLAVLPEGLVDVHAGATVAGEWLGHEGGGLLVELRGVLHDVLEGLHVVRGVQEGVEAVVDFLLSAGAHLVVGAFDVEADVLQVLTDFVAEVLHVVVRRGGEVAALGAHLVAQVAGAVRVLLRAGVPPALDGVHLVEGLVGGGVVAHGVEDVELRLGTEVAGVGEAEFREVLLSLAGDVARVAAEWFAGVWVVDEELHVQRLGLAEGVHKRGVEVGQQHHVGVVDAGVAGDGGAVECEAFLDRVLVEGGRWHGEVLFDAWDIGELDVYPADRFVADEFLDAFWGGVFASGVELTHGVSLRFLAFVVCKSCSYSVVYQFSLPMVGKTPGQCCDDRALLRAVRCRRL